MSGGTPYEPLDWCAAGTARFTYSLVQTLLLDQAMAAMALRRLLGVAFACSERDGT